MKTVTPALLIATVAILQGCSQTPQRCENIEEIVAQRQECEELVRRIKQTDSVVVRTNLQALYDEQCVNLRFYRDGFDDEQVCSVKAKQEHVKKAQQELNQPSKEQ